ncbi:hypothetical protein BD310DRAFT_925192 [Dichomitus squalens]|uniref:Uncharacterized protein n=1 Tax=Dichomitus squalens TaxID=114155 RepID=A0A4Q9PXH0_9APHY|nr:hypothetical protein BD310DRAFT_925192 [Dichomitus squalens]
MPYGFEWDNQHVRSDRLISWPNLRSLVIAGAGREAEEEEDDEVDEIRPVLEHIRVPESCDFFLEIVNAKASPYGDCLPNDPSCIRHLEKAIEATWGDPSCFECRCPASTTSDQRGVSLTEPELKGRLRVDIDPVGMWCWLDKETTDQEDRALAEFRHYLGRAPLRTLTLACGPSLRGFLEVLRAFPALTELALDCKRSGRVPQRDAICEFLSALAGGKMASEAWSSAAVPKLRSGKGGVPMTNLRVLRLDYVLWYDEMADDIERCLWSRVVGGAENLDDVRIHFNGVVKDEEESGEDGQALEKEFEEDGQALPKGGSRLKVLKHLVNGLVVVSDFDREWEL